ncbi:hypothetical protein CGLO_14948 [Colletotrichum gloeosporioides Cg-14]|uniref:Uncharacterized protein n=1 Tax=Colletotrichum gloeosporioides (strain Cg-14) TaxID=1237896 RepID=T0LCK6_COLGC|nr:hypothetical protein CGLO_14948 [Colletotrichum gloeosporioides Cg-14]
MVSFFSTCGYPNFVTPGQDCEVDVPFGVILQA